MNKKNAFTLLVLLSLLLTQLAVVPATALAASCDAAQFVADVTVQDGAGYQAGATFDKTWRLKNAVPSIKPMPPLAEARTAVWPWA